MAEIVRFAQIQTSVHTDKMENIRALEPILAELSKQKVDFVTLPEMFCCPYETSCFPAYAEEVGGAVWSACAGLAARYGIYLSAGSMPEAAGGKVYNTAFVFDRQGKQIAAHRKMHLFDIDVEGGQHFRESETLSAGNQVTVFDTEFGKMGLCICYDFRFPELARLMVQKGAKVLLVPAAFNMTTGPAHWELLFRSRAVDNQSFTLGTAPARDLSASYHSWGHTIVVDPWGTVLGQLEDAPGVQVLELDLERVEAVRQQLPLLRHRRTDLYRLSEL